MKRIFQFSAPVILIAGLLISVSLFWAGERGAEAVDDSDGVTLSAAVQSSITLGVDSPTESFGNLTPGVPIDTFDTQTTVDCNAASGYTLGVSDSIASTDSALLHTDTTTRIADYAGTIETPTSWTGTGLGICVYAADTEKDAKWGTGTTANDSNNNYAGIPETTTTIHTVSAGPVSSDTADIAYKIDVTVSQKTGSYSGDVTYTATATP